METTQLPKKTVEKRQREMSVSATTCVSALAACEEKHPEFAHGVEAPALLKASSNH